MKLSERVHVVGSGGQGFGLSHELDCHVYLVNGGTEMALIDAGVGLEPERMVAQIRAGGLDPHNLKYLLLTHAHADHAGACKFWKDAFGVRVLASPESARFVSRGDEAGISLAVAKAGGFYPPGYHFPACPVDAELSEGDLVRVGDCELRAIETPGHCSGMLSYWSNIKGTAHLFCGDTVFHGGKILLINIYDCDFQQYVRSVQKLGELPVDALLPGHQCVALSGGHAHIQKALDCLARMKVPPNIL